jgi:hypothetical protein
MPLYIVIWRDVEDDNLLESEWMEPTLVQAGIRARQQLPEGTEIVSVQEARYAWEFDDE